MTSRAISNDKGFTLIELLIVIAITLLIVGVAAPLSSKFQTSVQLAQDTSQVIQALRTARQRSVARVNNTAHGVLFEINGAGAQDRYILYQGSTFIARDASYDRAATLQSSISLSTTLTGNEVNFSKGLGVPNTTGQVVLSHAVQGSKTLVVNALGAVEEQ